MKKITLLLILLTTSLGFSQQQLYNLGFEPSTPSGVPSVWYTFDNSPPLAEIVTNPDPDGVNPSATTKVLKVVMGPANNCYAGVNNRWQDKLFGTWKLDAAVPSNTTVSIDINKNYVGTVGIQMLTSNLNTTAGGGAAPFTINNQNVDNTVVDQWQTLTWTLPSIAVGLESQISGIVIFVDWTCDGSPDRAPNSTIYIDNIRFNAEKQTDPPVPTCSDGIQNGDETGVDCGGTNCSACIPNPIVSAPAPVIPESEVLSVYSNTYTTNTVTGFVFQDFSGGGPNTQVDIEGNGNMSAKIQNLSYYGPSFGLINVGVEDSPGVPRYNYVHLDYYATTSNEIKFYVIDGDLGACCGDNREPRYTIKATGGDEVLVKGVWKSVFIPLSFFKTYPGLAGLTWNGNPVTQLKFEGNGDLYYDNIYFSKNNTLSTPNFSSTTFSSYPNPTQDSWTVKANNATSISSIQVFDVLGKNVISITPNSNEAIIDAKGLNSGMYFARVSSENGSNVIKLIKN